MVRHVLAGIVLSASGACAGWEGGRTSAVEAADEREAVARVLDDFHDAASRADEARYFSHFDDEAVFLGTDGGERWTRAEFLAYARPHFAQGRGWTYVPVRRDVVVDAGARTAWFDEELMNASYGRCRGTGVLRRSGGTWKIVQYNLTVPIPNELLKEFAERIREWEGGRGG